MGKAEKSHDFYCINCGNKGIPLIRKVGFQRNKFHRKKLYCIYCKTEVNHVECRNQDEINQFLKDFQDGVYKDEAKESLSYIEEETLHECLKQKG